MGSSTVVALSRATVDGRTLLGHNNVRPAGEAQSLVRIIGRAFAPGEGVAARFITVPQARQTFTVLGNRPAGEWGFTHGVNERGVAVGCTPVFSRVACERPGLTGPDLARLVLERAGSAVQGVDVATDLIDRHGQGDFPGHAAADNRRDMAMLIADEREAYLVAAAGPHWALQEISTLRAVTGVCHLRQDWNRVSRGLADLVIERGWWPEDGSKIDFEGTVSAGHAPSADLRRWGHATLQLEEQRGHIDASFLRRLLADHYEGCPDEADPSAPRPEDNSICRHAPHAGAPATVTSFIADIGGEKHPTPICWVAFGTPCLSVYFQILLDGDLPTEFTTDAVEAVDSVWWRMARLTTESNRSPSRRAAFGEALATLQAQFDQDALELVEGLERECRHDPSERRRRATAFMEHNLERFDDVWLSMLDQSRSRPGLAAVPG